LPSAFKKFLPRQHNLLVEKECKRRNFGGKNTFKREQLLII